MGAVLMEMDERWACEPVVYLSMEAVETASTVVVTRDKNSRRTRRAICRKL
jgi:hypothetical protein